MKVGFIGLGKLGLPVSIAMVQKGHEVYGYDLDIKKRSAYRAGKAGVYEPDIDNKLQNALASGLHIVDSVKEAVQDSKIVFVAVQTPSKPDDSFDTSYLTSAIKEVGSEIKNLENRVVLSIISTVLPRTVRTEVAPALQKSSQKIIGKNIGLCYNPSFIAMGRVIEDFYNPEFILIGESDRESGRVLEKFYERIVPKSAPKLHMTWENAEIVKMAYNTMIGFKIVYANTLMEMCHKIPSGDVDVISDTLSKAHFRITSAAYLRGGMGDGGACHPRDNLALSWLAKKLDLAADPFRFVMEARKLQCEWLANLLISYNLPIVIMGIRFKPNTNLTDYSASLLVKDILVKKGYTPIIYDPIAQKKRIRGCADTPSWERPPDTPSVFLITLDEPFVKNFGYPEGSVVVDPWRCLNGQRLKKVGVTYVPVGKHCE